MPFLRQLLIALVCCALAVSGRAQSSSWKSMKFGKVSLHYPPTWTNTKATFNGQTRVTLTPDSMKDLSMRIVEFFELPLDGTFTYANFKSGFASLLKAQPDAGIKVPKCEEITFKEHKTMYAEAMRKGLPTKVYAIDGGTRIYLFFLLPRRYSTVPDPALERDEKAILNSITFDQ
jgi:hypothetical protein